MKKIVMMLVMAITVVDVFALTERVGNITWTYTVANGEATVYGRQDLSGSTVYYYPAIPKTTTGAIAIPEKLGGCPVTTVSDYAFYGCAAVSSIQIPNSVKSIGASAFGYCSSLMSISIPKSVTSIAGGAFSGTGWYNSSPDGLLVLDGCAVGMKGSFEGEVIVPEGCWLLASSLFGWYGSKVTSVKLPESLRVICRQTFSSCTALTSIRIPQGVSLINGNPFYGCKNLGIVDVDEDSQFYKAVDGLLLSKDGKTLVWCAASKSSVMVPDTVMEISDLAFYGCSKIEELRMPLGLIFIHDNAFANCTNLERIYLPGDVDGIGADVFSGCYALRGVFAIDGDVTKLKSKLAKSTAAISGIAYYHGEFTEGNFRYVICEDEQLAIVGVSENGDLSGKLTLPLSAAGISVCEIMPKAFLNCGNVESVEIHDGIHRIGSDAFKGCHKLSKVYWSTDWTSGVIVALNDDDWTESISSGEMVFKSKNLSSSEYSHLSFAVENSTSLSLYIGTNPSSSAITPRGYCSVDGGPEKYVDSYYQTNVVDKSGHVICYRMTKAYDYYGSSSETIATYMKVRTTPVFKDWFPDANRLEVVVGYNVSRLPEGLLSGCENLSRIVIPKTLKSIGTTAFWRCPKLSEIVVEEGSLAFRVEDGCLLSADGKVLYAVASRSSCIIPDSVQVLNMSAFEGHNELHAVVIPSSVLEVGAYAFLGCSGLASVTLPENINTLGVASFQGVPRVSFLGRSPKGFSGSGLQNAGLIEFPRKHASSWKSYATANNYAIRRGPTAAILSTAIRETDPTIMDVEYMVTSESPTVKVRALAFKNGVRSFANVVRPETFVDGTAVNIGDAIEANVPHKLSWRVSADYGIELTKMKFEVIAQEGDLLPMEWIYIPKSEQYGKMKVSYNTLSEAQVFDALMWLYAAKDPGLTLSGGTLRGGGYTLASGAGLYNTQGSYVSGVGYTYNYYAHNYVFAKMGWSVLSGAVLNYANSETRKGLSPSGIRQYAYQIVEQ